MTSKKSSKKYMEKAIHYIILIDFVAGTQKNAAAIVSFE